jgi:tetratricopeptide (TPR) repeat protein
VYAHARLILGLLTVSLPAHANSADPIRQRGLKLLQRSSFAEAAEQFRRVTRILPNSVEDRALYANALTRLGRVEDAVVELRLALAVAPNSPDIHALLGQILARNGQRVKAVQHFERALASAPKEWVKGELMQVKQLITESVHNWHLGMLGDSARNNAFQAAIDAAVRPDDIVLDIGTGTGLLAMMAARAGANHVVACEAKPELAELAKLIVEDNGYGSQIKVVNKNSKAMIVGEDLPGLATLLISETFDATLIGEGALNTFNHAKKALLAPGARIIPSGGVVRGQLAQAPQLKSLHPLHEINGFDLSVFARYSLERQYYPIQLGIEPWTALSEPFDVVRFDFHDENKPNQQWPIPVPVTQSGTVQTLILWFDLHLDGKTMLSSGPDGPGTHWNIMAFLFERERPVIAGETLVVKAEMSDGDSLYFDLP